MPEKHISSFEYYDLVVDVDDEGDVMVTLKFVEPTAAIEIPWDELREALEFIGEHGLRIENPWFGPYSETVEGASQLAEA